MCPVRSLALPRRRERTVSFCPSGSFRAKLPPHLLPLLAGLTTHASHPSEPHGDRREAGARHFICIHDRLSYANFQRQMALKSWVIGSVDLNQSDSRCWDQHHPPLLLSAHVALKSSREQATSNEVWVSPVCLTKCHLEPEPFHLTIKSMNEISQG